MNYRGSIEILINDFHSTMNTTIICAIHARGEDEKLPDCIRNCTMNGTATTIVFSNNEEEVRTSGESTCNYNPLVVLALKLSL